MNIVFTDKFLGNAFLTYGADVIKFSNMNQETRYDPMIAVSFLLPINVFYLILLHIRSFPASQNVPSINTELQEVFKSMMQCVFWL